MQALRVNPEEQLQDDTPQIAKPLPRLTFIVGGIMEVVDHAVTVIFNGSPSLFLRLTIMLDEESLRRTASSAD